MIDNSSRVWHWHFRFSCDTNRSTRNSRRHEWSITEWNQSEKWIKSWSCESKRSNFFDCIASPLHEHLLHHLSHDSETNHMAIEHRHRPLEERINEKQAISIWNCFVSRKRERNGLTHQFINWWIDEWTNCSAERVEGEARENDAKHEKNL